MKALGHLAFVSVALVLGCSSEQADSTGSAPNGTDGGASTGAQAGTEPGKSSGPSFDTPEAVFTAFSQALENEDWKSGVTMITDESKQMIVMGMVMQASFMTFEDEAKGKELEQLFKKHGLDEETLEGAGAAEEVDVNSLVQDLPAFIGELSDWILANATEADEGFPQPTGISELQVDGDSAQALAETESGPQPIEFRRVDGQWKVHLAMGPPPEPTLDELGLDFESIGEGEIGSMRLGDKTSPLHHALAYRAKFFEEPCIELVLTAVEVSDDQRSELEQQLKDEDGDAMFFPDGPHIKLTFSPEGDLMGMHVWIDNSSMSGNRGPAVEVQIEGNQISGRVGMAPEDYGGQELEFLADFDAEIRF